LYFGLNHDKTHLTAKYQSQQQRHSQPEIQKERKNVRLIFQLQQITGTAKNQATLSLGYAHIYRQ
jgi:hypothetical protein